MSGCPVSLQLEVGGVPHREEWGGKVEVPLGCMPGQGGLRVLPRPGWVTQVLAYTDEEP